MSTEENRAIARRIFKEVINGRNLNVLKELIAPDYAFYGPEGHTLNGIEGFKQLISQPHAAFPDFLITAEDMVAEGDKVVCRFSTKGTQKGMLGSIPATNKQIRNRGILIYRIVNGKVAEHWEILDMLSAMQQLGVFPSPGNAKK